jgi:hypothetical protein
MVLLIFLAQDESKAADKNGGPTNRKQKMK